MELKGWWEMEIIESGSPEYADWLEMVTLRHAQYGSKLLRSLIRWTPDRHPLPPRAQLQALNKMLHVLADANGDILSVSPIIHFTNGATSFMDTDPNPPQEYYQWETYGVERA